MKIAVVKLFNVIQQSQSAAVATAEELKTHRGSGKPTLPAPTPDSKSKMKMKGKNKDNPIGRGKESSCHRLLLSVSMVLTSYQYSCS